MVGLGRLLGQSKNHNYTYPYPGGTTIPHRSGWACEAFYPSGTKIENAVWFQLPDITSSRTAYIYESGHWFESFWDHQYATGSPHSWDPNGSYNYFLQIPNRFVCLGYSKWQGHHMIHAWAWYE